MFANQEPHSLTLSGLYFRVARKLAANFRVARDPPTTTKLTVPGSRLWDNLVGVQPENVKT